MGIMMAHDGTFHVHVASNSYGYGFILWGFLKMDTKGLNTKQDDFG
jgi:hypothetical protein